jgi:hypothetical protein
MTERRRLSGAERFPIERDGRVVRARLDRMGWLEVLGLANAHRLAGDKDMAALLYHYQADLPREPVEPSDPRAA